MNGYYITTDIHYLRHGDGHRTNWDYVAARTCLASAHNDVFLIHQLREIVYRLGEMHFARLSDDEVISQVARYVVDDRVRLELHPMEPMLRARAGGGSKSPQTSVSEAPPLKRPRVVRKSPALTWVEFQLIGEDNEPIPDEPYELELPNGNLLTGRLNKEGIVHVEDIDKPGECKFTFNELDVEAWGEVGQGSQSGSAPPQKAGRTITIQPGDSTSSLAFQFGHFPDTLWAHPNNASLRSNRKYLNVLANGDKLFVPKPRPKEVRKPTGAIHPYQRWGVPEKLVLVIKENGKPRSGVPYTLDMGDRHYAATTGSDGRIEHFLMPDVHEGQLVLNENEKHTLAIGHLEPVEEDEGVWSRMRNLGFLDDDSEDEDAKKSALTCFQEEHGMTVTGEVDQATRDRLRQEHGT